MKIAVTGATGFLGRELVEQLLRAGHQVRAWQRPDSRHAWPAHWASAVESIPGDLRGGGAAELVDGTQAVIHAAVWREESSFQTRPSDLVEYARVNILGTLGLIEASRAANVERFLLVSSCAVHDEILDDRPLDETHPLWPRSHYGAHKAALEAFMHSYARGDQFPICAVRPTGIYGLAPQPSESKWYSLVARVAAGQNVDVSGGGKEVHVSDVAAALIRLLEVDAARIQGQALACYDRYISQREVAELARELSGSQAQIHGEAPRPRHEIATGKIRELGVTFGGQARLRQTIQELLNTLED